MTDKTPVKAEESAGYPAVDIVPNAKLRGDILGRAQIFKEETVTLANGRRVLFREPNVARQAAVYDKARLPNGTINWVLMQVYAVIECAYNPDTNEKLFTEADFDVLSEMPVSGPLGEMARVAVSLVNGRIDEAKNSEATPAAGS